MMAMMLAMMMKHAVDDDHEKGYLAMRQRFSMVMIMRRSTPAMQQGVYVLLFWGNRLGRLREFRPGPARGHLAMAQRCNMRDAPHNGQASDYQNL